MPTWSSDCTASIQQLGAGVGAADVRHGRASVGGGGFHFGRVTFGRARWRIQINAGLAEECATQMDPPNLSLATVSRAARRGSTFTRPPGSLRF